MMEYRINGQKWYTFTSRAALMYDINVAELMDGWPIELEWREQITYMSEDYEGQGLENFVEAIQPRDTKITLDLEPTEEGKKAIMMIVDESNALEAIRAKLIENGMDGEIVVAKPREVRPTKSGMLQQLFAVSQALQGGNLEKAIHDSNLFIPMRDFNVAIEGFEKISPEEAFITAGQDSDTGLFHAAVMQRNEIKGAPNPWKVLSTNADGFLASHSAKIDAAKKFPLLPVLDDKPLPESDDTFSYPFYTKGFEMKCKIKTQAREKEARRQIRIAEKMRRSKDGNSPKN